MKKILALLFASFIMNATFAQKWAPLDKSPMDVAYYPAGYPSMKTRGNNKEALRMRVFYSRPSQNGREIYGTDLVPYGKVWRLGANEATEIEFFTDAVIGNKKIAKGRYTIYALVTDKDWTYILNKETDVWGAFAYDAKKDVVRVTVPVIELKEPIEALTISIDKTDKGVLLTTGWGLKAAALPIKF